MGKIMKIGKVVLILNGRYAGRKAVVVKHHLRVNRSFCSFQYFLLCSKTCCNTLRAFLTSIEDDTDEFMSDSSISESDFSPDVCRMPRYMVDIQFDKSIVNKEVLKDPAKRRKARRDVKSKFEERYKTGKSRWFFQKLRF
ncbi:large ribosomal subunit protein eL27 [Parasteatoda tepidariorum]|uniref:large ribosomal subunit protein eL27 n=1 Tax=Parasteatoda tepidariorum TaxID=114398 RepID=UPI0039BCC7BD